MDKNGLILIIEEYARLLGVNFDPFKLRDEKGRWTTSDVELLSDLVKEIKDIGERIDVSFLKNSLTVEEVKDFLVDEGLPAIVFRRKPNNKFEPLIIFEEDEDSWALIFYEDNRLKKEKSYKNTGLFSELIRYHEYKELIGEESEGSVDHILILTGIKTESAFTPSAHKYGDVTKPMARFFQLLKTERKEIGYIYFYAILIGIINLLIPLGIQGTINLISGGVFINSVVVLMGVVIVATFVNGWLQVLQISAVELLQQRLFVRTGLELGNKIPKWLIKNLSSYYPPELLNRFFDVSIIQKSLPKILIDFSSAVLQIVFGLVLLAFYHPVFIIFIFVLLIALFIYFRLTSPKGLETSIKESHEKYKLIFWLQEIARTLPVLKRKSREGFTIEKTDRILYDWLNARKKHFVIFKNQAIWLIGFKTSITAGLLILGSFLVVDRTISLGQFVASEIIIIIVISSIEKLVATIEVVYDLLTSFDKVGKLTDFPYESHKGIAVDEIITNNEYNFTLNDVSLDKPGINLSPLKNLNLELNAGDRMWFVGNPGNGQTTFSYFLAGFFTDYSGSFLVNGISFRELDLGYYRDRVGMVLLGDDLFDGTLEENLTLGREHISFKQIAEVLDFTGLRDIVSAFPEGLKKVVSPGLGFNKNFLKERIMIARMLLGNPYLIIIDERVGGPSPEMVDLYRKAAFYKPQAITLYFTDDIDWAKNQTGKIANMKSGQIIFNA